MPIHKLALAVASSILLGACSTFAPHNGPSAMVGPDYMATGNTTGVKAFVYGERTLLEYERPPYFLSVTDASGNSVGYEQEGRFIVWNARS